MESSMKVLAERNLIFGHSFEGLFLSFILVFTTIFYNLSTILSFQQCSEAGWISQESFKQETFLDRTS